MSGGFPYIDIILLAMFAAFIALRLRSVLGRRTGNERRPPEEVQRRYESVATNKDQPATIEGEAAVDLDAPKADYRMVLGPSSQAFDGVDAIGRADRNFDVDQFVAGARAAYEMILSAFWANELDELRPLVSDSVYDDFAGAAAERKSRNVTLDNRLERVRKIEFQDARIDGKHAEITLKFVGDVRLMTKDSEGRIIAGNPVDATEAIDVWTFERDLGSRDPNWTLVATASDE